jgi:hypothetical protein
VQLEKIGNYAIRLQMKVKDIHLLGKYDAETARL